jgi:hypothetical protein
MRPVWQNTKTTPRPEVGIRYITGSPDGTFLFLGFHELMSQHSFIELICLAMITLGTGNAGLVK